MNTNLVGSAGEDGDIQQCGVGLSVDNATVAVGVEPIWGSGVDMAKLGIGDFADGMGDGDLVRQVICWAD